MEAKKRLLLNGRALRPLINIKGQLSLLGNPAVRKAALNRRLRRNRLLDFPSLPLHHDIELLEFGDHFLLVGYHCSETVALF